MITNLLDKSVVFDGKDCKICAIYQHEDKILFCVVDDDGIITNEVCPNKFRINEQRVYSVVMYWTPERKIHAIKTVREILGLGLREAKDLVENNPSGVPVKSGLTHAEAKEVLRIVTYNGQEGQIKG
jgi:large subunit ribosomal protein L7/L12